MTCEADSFDRELGELVQLHRTAKGLSVEDLATEIGLPATQVERYEAGSNRLSVKQYFSIMSALDQDPARVLEQLQEWLSLSDGRTEHARPTGVEFMASNRGRQVINALAMCDEPEVLDALADLILAVGVHARAGVRYSRPRTKTHANTDTPG